MKINKIIKPKRFERFTVIPSAIFRFKNISIGATGLYAYLFSHDIKQEITITFICNHFKDGRDAINSRFKELIDNGYLIRERITEKGKYIGKRPYYPPWGSSGAASAPGAYVCIYIYIYML